MANNNPAPKAGVPNVGHGGKPDLSQPTAFDVGGKAVDERLAQDDAQRQHNAAAGPARGVIDEQREEDERLAIDREASIEEARGGRERVFSQDDWDRANAPTDPERRRQIRDHYAQTLLPNLPKKPGRHRCWVSTSHNSDTPQRRRALGYRFLTYAELAAEGWQADEYAIKDAASVYNGCVMWREMIAMDCDTDLHHAIMREMHHDAPMEQARSIYETLDAAGQEARDRGGRTQMAPGMEKMREFTRPPQQFET